MPCLPCVCHKDCPSCHGAQELSIGKNSKIDKKEKLWKSMSQNGGTFVCLICDQISWIHCFMSSSQM